MILCCGEALIDMIPTETTTGAIGFVPHAGGAVFNTAIALGRLGARAGMLTGLSSDQFGQQLAASLAASHVDASHVVTSARLSTVAFVHLVDGHATYTFYDENSAGRMLAPSDLPPLKDDVCALYFGGISLVFEPAADTYLSLLRQEHTQRAIMLDPNIRPGFITDEAAYRARLAEMIALADIVKVSDEDLGWIYPEPTSIEDKFRKLSDAGPSVVILTRGADGATARTKGGQDVSAPAKRVEVVDTVGAGDTFNAGVLAYLSEKGALTKAALAAPDLGVLKAALSFGAAVAGITVSRAGAKPPWREDLS